MWKCIRVSFSTLTVLQALCSRFKTEPTPTFFQTNFLLAIFYILFKVKIIPQDSKFESDFQKGIWGLYLHDMSKGICQHFILESAVHIVGEHSLYSTLQPLHGNSISTKHLLHGCVICLIRPRRLFLKSKNLTQCTILNIVNIWQVQTM